MTLDQVINLLATVTLFEMMVAIGLGVAVVDVLSVVRNGWMVLRAALANYVLVPGVVVGLLLLMNSQPLVAAGFLIAAVCPGAPYGPPFTSLAGGKVPQAVGLMVLLAASSALLAPLLLSLLLPVIAGDEIPRVDPIRIVTALLFTQLLPLLIGLIIRRQRPNLADRIQRPANRLSMFLNLALLATIVIAQFTLLIGIPMRAFAGMTVLLAAMLAVGWLSGGSGSANRKTMAIVTSVRNAGVCLVIASSSFPGTPAVTAVLVYGLFQTIALALIALAWGKHSARKNTESNTPTPPVANGPQSP